MSNKEALMGVTITAIVVGSILTVIYGSFYLIVWLAQMGFGA